MKIIAGNSPQVSEIAPLLIIIRLEEFDYAGATAIAAAMLVLSFALLLLINLLQARVRRRQARPAEPPPSETAHPILQGSLG